MMPRYRAWDKEFKEMVQVNALALDEQVIKVTYKNKNVVKDDVKEYELMQSTGLKDKNGKEIFEGDILTSQNYPVKGVVEFRTDLGLWVHYLKGYNYFEYLGNVAGSKEIIGNIYENPDLLEDNK